uniref:MgtE domain-containing protein n=1 Tax=Elaeophora elaphi TaxID=1147741 RepID=A0A0R3RG97_9BILA
MELASISVSSLQHDRQQQRTSLTQSNSHRWKENVALDEKQQQWLSEQSSTSLTNTSLSPTALMSTSMIDSENSGNNYCGQPKSDQEIRELDREKLVRFVYFGQAILVIIVALVWVAFIILESNPPAPSLPETITGNITVSQNELYGTLLPVATISDRISGNSHSGVVSLVISTESTLTTLLLLISSVVISHYYYMFL